MKKLIIITVSAVIGIVIITAMILVLQNTPITTVQTMRARMSLQDLVQKSDLIIIGKIISQKERAIFDDKLGYEIGLTDTEVAVHEIIKGTLQNPKSATVTMLGAESTKTYVSGEVIPKDRNQSYVWFLATGEDENHWAPYQIMEKNNNDWKVIDGDRKVVKESDFQDEIKRLKPTR